MCPVKSHNFILETLSLSFLFITYINSKHYVFHFTPTQICRKKTKTILMDRVNCPPQTTKELAECKQAFKKMFSTQTGLAG